MSIFDPIRQQAVAATPEEVVRQRLIEWMVTDLGYPQSLLVVERALASLPHLAGQKLPHRRLDLLCFAKGIHPEHELYPLLLVECKAVAITAAVLRQVIGYNSYVGAYAVAAANGEEVRVGYCVDALGSYSFSSGLPRYEALLQSVVDAQAKT